jgi:hypothetical protein
MPLHDWTRVPAGLFHDFHQSWTIRIKDALNAGLLPTGYSALAEPRSAERVEAPSPRPPQGGAVRSDRPSASIVRRVQLDPFAAKANRIAIRHHLGRVVAVIEIVSPGNKDSRAALRDFADKVRGLLTTGIHVVLVDPFPPGPRDPSGLHKVIWDDFVEEPFDLPPGRDRLAVSYECGHDDRVAYIEPLAVGDDLPAMPLFLAPEWHVPLPLEATYRATWDAAPAALRHAVETGQWPEPDGA